MFALALDSYEQQRAASMWMDLCTVKTSSKKKEENAERSGLGRPVLKGEGLGVSYDTPIGSSKQTWIHDVFALATRITEEAIEDNLYELDRPGGGDELKELSKDLGVSMEDNLEVLVARILNSGTATTYHATRGARSLYSASHVRLDSSTYANYATSSDLTYETFWAAAIAAENQYDHKQKKMVKKVKNLWVPREMEYKAIEVLKSTERPDTADRSISAIAASGRNRIAIKAWNQLTDVDAWHLQLEGRGITFFWRRKTRFARERDFQTGDMMMKADQRFSVEIDDPRGLYGIVP
jgi:hypothetical protein